MPLDARHRPIECYNDFQGCHANAQGVSFCALYFGAHGGGPSGKLKHSNEPFR